MTDDPMTDQNAQTDMSDQTDENALADMSDQTDVAADPMPEPAGVGPRDDALERAVENEAAVEALVSSVEGDDAAADGIEAIADAEEIEPDEVLVESPVDAEAELDRFAEDEAILDEDQDGTDEGADDEGAADEGADDEGGADEGADDEGADEGVEAIDEDELLEESPAPPKAESPYDRPGKWFVLHTQSGYENKVRQNIEARRASMNMESRIHEVVIPMEDVVEFKQGKKVVVQKKMFPGYLLVRCSLDDDSWYVIRNTPGVTGFVGAGNKPQPLPRREVETFLGTGEEVDSEQPAVAAKTRTARQYEINETVRVKEGPFADFSGEIIEINEDQLKVKVLVNIFGRETPVELEFSQVAKL